MTSVYDIITSVPYIFNSKSYKLITIKFPFQQYTECHVLEGKKLTEREI